MKINKIQINGFGNLKNKSIQLKNGINLIHGNNEVGKSTLVNFIKAIFYGVNRNKGGNDFSELERFKPWGESDFSGKIEYEINGNNFSAVRDFNKNNCKVFDTNGNDMTNNFNKDKSRGLEIGMEQLGMDEEIFINSIFVSQARVSLDDVERKSITQKLTNMIQSGDEAVSYEKTKQKLQKKLLDEVGTERTQNKPLNSIMREVTLLEEKKENLIANRTKQENIIDNEKMLDEKLKIVEAELFKTSKVLEIRERYDRLLKERENDYEISQKIAEKEYQKKIEVKNKMKRGAKVASAVVTVILMAIFTLLKLYIFVGVSAIAGIIALVCVEKIMSKEVKKSEVPNFDVVKEDFKKKEDKELEMLKKYDIKEGTVSRKLNELRQLMEGLKKKKEDLLLEKHKLKIENDNLKENLDRLNEIEERLEELHEKEEEIRKLEYSLKLASLKLDEAYEELKAEVVPEFENEIKKNISETTNGKYNNIIYNDTQGLLVENSVGEIITIDKLSIGTVDQMYLGFRFAIARKLGDIPIILDESFAYYDDERLENIMKVINDNFRDKQVIILSCSDREKRMLESVHIGYNLIEI